MRWRTINRIGTSAVLFGFTLLVPMNAINLKSSESENIAPAYCAPKTVTYGYAMVNKAGRPLTDLELLTEAPVHRTSGQECCEKLSASEESHLVQDPSGNQRLRLHIGAIPPYGRKEIRVEAQLKTAWAPVASDAPSGAFLGAERFVEVDHPKIQAIAKTLRDRDPMETAHRTFHWVADHLRDSGYLRDDRGALYALEHERGDCTEYMYLFVALAKANGIPARPMAGSVVKGNGVLRARGYHNWAKFYAHRTWHIADPHRGVFNDGYSDYVATRIIGKPAAAALGSDRFSSTAPGLEVKMR
jgi:hypothetical protein